MTHKPTISAIIITYNEERNIRACLQSLRDWVDEIVVVDSASTDATVAIAQEFGAVVKQTQDWPGFGPQKNRALSLATSEWVLSIDADERITPELSIEIQQVMRGQHEGQAFEIPRFSSYCGRFMKHSGWYPDYVLRLFKRGHAQFSNDLVHERVTTEDHIAKLSHPLLHFSFNNFSQVLKKIDAYSEASALQAYKKGRRANVFTAVGHGLWSFIKTYFLKAGFLDGQHGLALAISNGEGSYYRHLKIWLLETNETSTDQRHTRDL
jgi:glycosyltransferase involved in cell wall biosynthesis